MNRLDIPTRVAIAVGSFFLAAFDTAVLYLIVDYTMGYTLTWGAVLTAWWILEVTHNLDFISDYKNGVY